MFFIEKIEYAPKWMQETVKQRKPEAKYVAFFRLYTDRASEKYPSLRDKTDMVASMMKGLVNDLDAKPAMMIHTGHEFNLLHEFDAIGAQHVQLFTLMYI